MQKRLSEIAEFIGGALEGEDIFVSGISGVEGASENYLTFMENDRHRRAVEESAASAVIIPLNSKEFTIPVIRVKNPRLAFAQVLAMFNVVEKRKPGIHALSSVAEDAVVSDEAYVGPYVVIEKGAVIESGVEIYPFSYVGEGVFIGKNSILEPRVTIMKGCRISDNCLIHSGAVIGADGFGFVRNGAEQVKIPQVGIVDVASCVEIGANTTIDRATTGETSIGAGTKIDNLVQIGHNVSVGKDCTIVSQSGIAGSSRIGDRVIIAAQAGIRDHTVIGADAIVGGRAGVTKPVKTGTVVSGYPARDHREELKIEAAVARLPEFMAKAEKFFNYSSCSIGDS